MSIVDEASPSEDEAIALAALRGTSPRTNGKWHYFVSSVIHYTTIYSTQTGLGRGRERPRWRSGMLISLLVMFADFIYL